MKFTRTPSFENAYPGLAHLFTPDDIEKAQRFLKVDAPEIAQNFKKDIITIELGGRVTRALFSKGEDDHTIIIPAEYATGLGDDDDLDAVMRAQAMRDTINDKASLLFVPNNAGKNSLGFSEEQRRIVRGTDTTPGSFAPLTDGIMAMLDSQNVADNRLTGVGNSHGAAVITSFAARSDVKMHSLSTFLPPDIIRRDENQLQKDFKSGPRHLFNNIAISKLGVEEATYLDQGIFDIMRFALSARDKDNQATIGPLLTGKHEKELQRALQNTPNLAVVRGWVPKTAISPAEANAKAGERLRMEFGERVENLMVTGNFARPTSANVWPISAILARNAFILGNTYQNPA